MFKNFEIKIGKNRFRIVRMYKFNLLLQKSTEDKVKKKTATPSPLRTEPSTKVKSSPSHDKVGRHMTIEHMNDYIM